jgi:hypothetical protein
VAAETAQTISSACPNAANCAASNSCSACHGCALGIAFVYKSFEGYLNAKFAEEFKTFSEQMFN